MPSIPGAWIRVQTDLDERIEAASAVAAKVTHDHLDEPGSGIQWPNLPNRSSAPGEYPARQFGPLQDSIGYIRDGWASFGVGSVINPPYYAVTLEFMPAALGGRRWLGKSMEDPDTHRQMNVAAANPSVTKGP